MLVILLKETLSKAKGEILLNKILRDKKSSYEFMVTYNKIDACPIDCSYTGKRRAITIFAAHIGYLRGKVIQMDYGISSKFKRKSLSIKSIVPFSYKIETTKVGHVLKYSDSYILAGRWTRKWWCLTSSSILKSLATTHSVSYFKVESRNVPLG